MKGKSLYIMSPDQNAQITIFEKAESQNDWILRNNLKWQNQLHLEEKKKRVQENANNFVTYQRAKVAVVK